MRKFVSRRESDAVFLVWHSQTTNAFHPSLFRVARCSASRDTLRRNFGRQNEVLDVGILPLRHFGC